eukprot:m51a1_g10290 hypothetical protein (250) ;mRNA; f:36309-37157
MASGPLVVLVAAAVLCLSGPVRALVCSVEVGSGCNVWATAEDTAHCSLRTSAAAHELIEARVPDNAGSTGYVLVPSSSADVRLVGNATVRPLSERPCMGCASTHAFFYEAAASGAISVAGVRPWGAHEHYDAFALGVDVVAGPRVPASCSGAFAGLEHNGSTLAVQRGALVEVRLMAAPGSTGYAWSADPATPADAEAVLPCRSPPLLGCSQTFVFFYRAASNGQQLRLDHVRFGRETVGVYVLTLQLV